MLIEEFINMLILAFRPVFHPVIQNGQGRKHAILYFQGADNGRDHCDHLGNIQTFLADRGDPGLHSLGFLPVVHLVICRDKKCGEDRGPVLKHLLAGHSLFIPFYTSARSLKKKPEFLAGPADLGDRHGPVLLRHGFNIAEIQCKIINFRLFTR